ncbi:universal stress protein [Fluoribacter dumoffii]|uniref:Universal stress protein n=1 Tax=Fluoribacter dumoffii TaxID=463 RepID=A0A377G783_9GAMM|nr:universal stress protein [Fluoribacter dumoffii]KTC89576.1 universal stress protein [Fluoribacter dumoffii NY 23]MCW8384770.1 universal stress protein [Fluoribacter dumoffii]MCW8417833.1 universal stress protein [Fluoribacter dumoffii]MCW8454325.1 universal stress protein [Fluoribacter dumoffii]MCW8461601.1 universal stress protein [Fluoribacter dumoffii]
MYQNILVAIDDSDTSMQALHEAIALSKVHHAKLRIIHVGNEFYAPYLGTGVDYEKLEASFKEYGQKLLNKMLTIAREQNADCDAQLLEVNPAHERVADKIITAAKNWPANLIVIGTHGRRGFQHLLLGSVAEGVVRNASMPVLLIRSK